LRLAPAGPAFHALVVVAVLRASDAAAQSPARAAPVEPSASEEDAPPPAEQGQVSDVAQPEPTSRRDGWVFLPGMTYTPETGLNMAGAAMRYFPGGARTSRLLLTVEASTSARGTVSFDPDVWFADGKYHLGGSAWANYLDYTYFGIGNDTRMADGEDFTAVRMTVRPELVRRVAEDLYAGALYELRYENVSEVEEGGMLDTGAATGGGGGLVSGLGLLVRWDSRDHSFAPRSGGVVTVSPRAYHSMLGSDFDFTRLLVDASWFVGLGGEHVLAAQGQIDLRGGEPPFSYMAQAGSRSLLRGMLEGRFRDRHFIGAQLEYRYPLWWRFGGVAFAGLGRVAPAIRDFDLTGLKYSVGGGLRFAIKPQERINVRLDFARSNDDSAYYFSLLEAF
jgi:outer membrane protein assembly factor BamA